MAKGEARKGPGRPKKTRPVSDQRFDSAENYLQAVVAGDVPADSVRVQAARTLIQYQQRKVRAPKPSPAPAEMAKRESKAEEKDKINDFEKKAAVIRQKFAVRRAKK
jgi:hypothetical protein